MLSPSANIPSGASPFIKEVTAQNFMAEVVQASLQVPVLVYFTAAWCGPCKQYGPLLEKVVNDAKGKVKLARVDVDANPQLAQQFRIQSVPMVYIFVQGQPMDGFAGAIPESQLKQMIAQLGTGGPEAEMIQETLQAAKAMLEEGNAAEAERIYKAILSQEPENPEALAGLARCFIAQGQLEDAASVLSAVPDTLQNHELIAAAKAAHALAQSAPKSGNEKALRDKIARDAKDYASRYELAGLLFASGKQEEAIDELLAIIGANKDWNEGAARTQLLTFFEALGHVHPLTMQGRRRLSTILFS